MQKFFSFLKTAAIVIGIGCILIGIFYFQESSMISYRITYIILGVALTAVALFALLRHILISLAFFALTLSGIASFFTSSNSISFASVLGLVFCMSLAVTFGYKVIMRIKEIIHMSHVDNSPDSTNAIAVTPITPIHNAPAAILSHTGADSNEHRHSMETSIEDPTDTANEYLVSAIVARWQRQHVNTQEATPTTMKDAFAMYGGINAELLTVDLMEGHDFEYWCANALQDMGFSEVQVTPGSGDLGVDIVAVKDNLKYAIQCKRYSADLGNAPIQEVYTGKTVYRCHIAAVITNRYFTPGAQELAAASGVLLWDRDWISNYIASKQNSDGAVFINHAISNTIPTNVEPEYDELLPEAVDVILETGQASVSMLQRRLKLGYARCARIVDEMEELGIVGPFHGSNPRTILINKAEWQLIRKQL